MLDDMGNHVVHCAFIVLSRALLLLHDVLFILLLRLELLVVSLTLVVFREVGATANLGITNLALVYVMVLLARYCVKMLWQRSTDGVVVVHSPLVLVAAQMRSERAK